MATPHSLGKNERLKSRKLIGQLFRDGRPLSVMPYKVLYLWHDVSAGMGDHALPSTVDDEDASTDLEPGASRGTASKPALDFSLQTAFAVSSKHFRKAVDRNRIKRLMREAYRIRKAPLKELLQARGKKLSVMIIYTGRELPQSNAMNEKMGAVIAALLKSSAA